MIVVLLLHFVKMSDQDYSIPIGNNNNIDDRTLFKVCGRKWPVPLLSTVVALIDKKINV